jgi:hypothetical protein
MKLWLRKFYLATLYPPHWCLGENMTSYLKMATVQEKAMYVLWFFETKSVIKTHCRYRTQYGKYPPADNAIWRWLKQFQETGCVLHQKGAGRLYTSQEDVDRIQEAFSRNPTWISFWRVVTMVNNTRNFWVSSVSVRVDKLTFVHSRFIFLLLWRWRQQVPRNLDTYRPNNTASHSRNSSHNRYFVVRIYLSLYKDISISPSENMGYTDMK